MTKPFTRIEGDHMEIFFNGHPHDVSTTDALALADAIYLAAGKLPMVEDEEGYRLLRWFKRNPDALFAPLVVSVRRGAERLIAMGLIEEYWQTGGDPENPTKYYQHGWTLTPAGREMAERMERDA